MMPPTAPHPKPSAETFIPVRPKSRICMAVALSYLHFDGADSLKIEPVVRRFLREDGLHHAAGHHDVARLQARAARGELRREPCGGIEGVAEDVAAVAFAESGAILAGAAERRRKVRPFRQEVREHNAGIPRIVRYQRAHIEIAVIGAAVVDELD